MSNTARSVWTNLHLATLCGTGADLGIVRDGVLVVEGAAIAWVGPRQDLPAALTQGARVIDAGGRWVTPGLVDAHTHLVFAGNRVREFALKAEGASYEEIARAGGGIRSTVAATRAATEEQLVSESLPRLDALLAEGVTTLEIKSGYGLTLGDEAKMLRAARTLGRQRTVRVRTTFLGLHAVPAEAASDPDAYVTAVVETMLPTLAEEGLVDAVDAFCERIAFSSPQTRRLFEAARARGLPVKLHAEQLSDQKGAVLAAEFGALSCDHLEFLAADGIAAMAAAGTVAMLLPGAFYFLKETHKPPVAALRAAGVPLALATDCNPGSSPITSPLTIMNMGVVLFGLSPAEALAGFTRVAARALGLADSIGTLEAGKAADVCLWSIAEPAELAYRIGLNPLWLALRAGVPAAGPGVATAGLTGR